MKSLLFIILICVATISNGQNINKNWEQDLIKVLQEFKSCENNVTFGINPCNRYIGQTLQTVYRVNDFYSEKMKRYMLVNEIADFLQSSQQWSMIGHGYEQKALEEAQKHANSGKAAVAIYLNEDGIGHLSVILPGELKPSGTWNFSVPNSASLFTIDPEASYINKGLSYAFMRSQIVQLKIYARK